VDLSAWLLSLHVLAAAALVCAEVLFSVLIVASRTIEVPSAFTRLSGVSRIGNVLVMVGSVGVLVLGVILAFQKDSYAIWDPWVVAAIVLWAIFGGSGQRVGAHYQATAERARALVGEGDRPSSELRSALRDSRALALHVTSLVAVVLLLVDMIFKPGA
jgi:hypothetical protein